MYAVVMDGSSISPDTISRRNSSRGTRSTWQQQQGNKYSKSATATGWQQHLARHHQPPKLVQRHPQHLAAAAAAAGIHMRHWHRCSYWQVADPVDRLQLIQRHWQQQQSHTSYSELAAAMVGQTPSAAGTLQRHAQHLAAAAAAAAVLTPIICT
jgi:hypothetical protein